MESRLTNWSCCRKIACWLNIYLLENNSWKGVVNEALNNVDWWPQSGPLIFWQGDNNIRQDVVLRGLPGGECARRRKNKKRAVVTMVVKLAINCDALPRLFKECYLRACDNLWRQKGGNCWLQNPTLQRKLELDEKEKFSRLCNLSLTTTKFHEHTSG
jgi:hypothetical protein